MASQSQPAKQDIHYKTHEKLIRRMKQQLKLPNLQSSFISRASIIQYINMLHQENQSIRFALDPPSIQNQLQQYSQVCAQKINILNERELQEKQLIQHITCLEEQINFIENQLSKNIIQAEIIEKQIGQLKEENETSHSRSSATEHLSVLMDKFVNYFENQDDPSKSTVSNTGNNVESIHLVKLMNKAPMNISLQRQNLSSSKNEESEQRESLNASQQHHINISKMGPIIPQINKNLLNSQTNSLMLGQSLSQQY